MLVLARMHTRSGRLSELCDESDYFDMADI